MGCGWRSGAPRGSWTSGGTSTPRGRRALAALERVMLERRLSPGGSADLLSAAIFLDALERPDSPEGSETEKGADEPWSA